MQCEISFLSFSKKIVAEIFKRERLLVPEIRIVGDKNLFQIIDDGRQNEFHRIKSFPMYSIET